jgi:predicted membrane-bound mannosyltransferase
MSKKKKGKVKKTENGKRKTENESSGVVEKHPDMMDKKIFDLPFSIFHLAGVIITAIAAFLRFFWLELKPMHHDEGVNGFFLTRLFREGIYQYDPANYHGPDLYYISLVFARLFGLNTISVRASVAIFGVLTVVLVFFLRRYIGTIGSLAAGLFLALSPGMVYISRYFIHEILFVFFSLSFVVALAYFIEKRKAGIFSIIWMVLLLMICFLPTAISLAEALGGENMTVVWALRIIIFAIEGVLIFFVMRMLLAWNEGRPIYFLLASASLILLFATKETAFITIGTMLIACVCVWLWRKIYEKAIGQLGEDELSEKPLTWKNFRLALGSSTDLLLATAAFVVVFIYVGVLFFSSFFTYPQGVIGFFEAYAIWTKTGGSDHTQNGRLAYARWLRDIEAPLIIL